MLGTVGQYLVDFQLGSEKNFINPDDYFSFTIKEYAGNIIPEFDLTFISHNNTLEGLLHEGTLIKCKIGRSVDTLQDATLYCTVWDSAKQGGNSKIFNISGFCLPLTFAVDYKYSSIVKKSAVEAVIEVAKKTFKVVKTNITKSNDSQNWIQPHQSDKDFIQKTLYRADLGDSFPAMAITFDGKFILKDIKKDLADKNNLFDWKFIRNSQPKNDKEINYVADPVFSSNTGLINKIIGYGFDLTALIVDTAKLVESKIDAKPIMANAKKVGGVETSTRKKIAGIQQTENVHTNYQKSYYSNLTNLLNLSRVEAHFSFESKFYPIKPLDKVMLMETDIHQGMTSSENQSGIYYVTYVSRTIQLKQFITTIKVNRESVNQVK